MPTHRHNRSTSPPIIMPIYNIAPASHCGRLAFLRFWSQNAAVHRFSYDIAANFIFGRESHARSQEESNYGILAVLPQVQLKTLSNDRRLHWIHPYKMLALPENVMARPFHSGQVNISFIKQSGALHSEYGLLAPSNGPLP